MYYFVAIGLLFFLVGLYRLHGPVSVTYLHASARLKSGNYLAIPGSIWLWLLALIASPPIPQEQQPTLVLASLGIMVFLAIIGSKYLKPKWLRWLEKYYEDIIPELEIEIQRIGPDNWDKQINTHEELEAWVYSYLKEKGISSTLHN